MDDVTGILVRVLAGPLCAALVIALICHKSPFYADFSEFMEKSAGGWIAIAFLFGSTMFAWKAFDYVKDGQPVPAGSMWYEFLSVGDFDVSINWSLDRLSALMLIIVCVVALCIFLYSLGYMHGDPGINRFFAKLSLFVFSMLGIVVSGNFLMMFIFWELVGLSSYLLIGFWYQRPSAAEAGKKAFLVNRLGDFGFLIGILLIWGVTGDLNFQGVATQLKQHPQNANLLAVATVLIFCGAIGKSAQFPLHVWLPDAMEGPTPVSALIHAATMVAAGVYMLCRVSFLVFDSVIGMQIIQWIGGITLFLSAVIATQQNDIKRILAYSTLSQLGYMVMAVGLSDPQNAGYVPAMFHLSTHAFFKALLFLAAGSVIIGFHHSEQDIWKMGGLYQKMPITTACFAVGMLALCGFPGLSGFYSKDAILSLAYDHNRTLFVLATITVGLTTFYMTRAFLVAFLGEARSERAGKVRESSWLVLAPLAVLAILSVLAGYSWFGIPGFLIGEKGMSPEPAPRLVSGMALGSLAAGGVLAALLYLSATEDPIKKYLPFVHRVLWNKFYIDESYLALVKYVQGTIAVLCGLVDRWIIAGAAVRGVAALTRGSGQMLRLFQTGNLQTYALFFALGLTIVLYCVIGK